MSRRPDTKDHLQFPTGRSALSSVAPNPARSPVSRRERQVSVIDAGKLATPFS